VNDDFYAEFALRSDKIVPGYQKFFARQSNDATLHFDLPGYLRERLRIYGLLEERIHDVELCTYSENEEFFSHRRSMQQGDAPCGRQVGGLFLE
jgi:copper oxidase (laccase) domain-containing protein